MAYDSLNMISLPPQPIGLRASPTQLRAENWVVQAKFWARAVGVVSLLAGGAALLFGDWNAFIFPPQIWIGIIWAAPAPIFILLSFFLRKWDGIPCIVVGLLAAVGAPGALLAPLLDKHNIDAFAWYYLLAAAVAAGDGILAFSSYWAYRWILEPISAYDRRRGFAILPHDHSIAKDRLK
jgi:hypothetical protein